MSARATVEAEEVVDGKHQGVGIKHLDGVDIDI